MALKKPSELFNNEPKKKVEVPEQIKGTLPENFDVYKSNLKNIEVLNDFVSSFGTLKENIQKVDNLQEVIQSLKEELQNSITKEDLDTAMISNLLVLEKNIQKIELNLKGINRKDLKRIDEEIEDIESKVHYALEEEFPKYKKALKSSEIFLKDKFYEYSSEIDERVNQFEEFIANSFEVIQENLEGINKQKLSEILKDFKNLDRIILKFKEEEIPRYKSFIIETKTETESKLNIFQKKLDETVNSILEKVDLIEGDKTNLVDAVNQKIKDIENIRDYIIEDLNHSEEYKKQISKKVNDLESEIIRNESHIRIQNKNLEKIQEDICFTIQKLNVEELEKKNYELGKKVKYLEEVFKKFSEKEILTENIIVEPPSNTNKDPLTPLDQNFVTIDQLQQHYRLFINRVQQQLSTIGGGGETRLKYLDDIVGIATNPSVYNNKYLKYNHSSGNFEFASVFGGEGVGYLTDLDDIDVTNLGDRRYLRYDASTSKFVFSTVSAEGLELIAGNIESGIVTTNSTSPSTIISFSASTYRSANFQIQVTNGSNYNITTINAVHDGSTSYMVEYGTINQPIGIATFSTEIIGGSLVLLGYPSFSSTTTFKVLVNAINT